MKKPKFSDSWEKLPNDLYIGNSFIGIPQVSIEAMNVIREEGVQQIDGYFKSRVKRNKKDKYSDEDIPKRLAETDITNQANSEIFINKKDGHKIYCFNGLILPIEQYIKPEDIKIGRHPQFNPPYTIMLLSEIISTSVGQVLLSYEVNEKLRNLSSNLMIELIYNRFEKNLKKGEKSR